jgi:hypothetical protein
MSSTLSSPGVIGIMRPPGLLQVDDEIAATLDAEAPIDCVQVELESPNADAEVRGEFLIPECAECRSGDLLLARCQACLSAALCSAIAARVFAGARSRILPSPRSGPGISVISDIDGFEPNSDQIR